MWFLPRDHACSKIDNLEQAAQRLRGAYS